MVWTFKDKVSSNFLRFVFRIEFNWNDYNFNDSQLYEQEPMFYSFVEKYDEDDAKGEAQNTNVHKTSRDLSAVQQNALELLKALPNKEDLLQKLNELLLPKKEKSIYGQIKDFVFRIKKPELSPEQEKEMWFPRVDLLHEAIGILEKDVAKNQREPDFKDASLKEEMALVISKGMQERLQRQRATKAEYDFSRMKDWILLEGLDFIIKKQQQKLKNTDLGFAQKHVQLQELKKILKETPGWAENAPVTIDPKYKNIAKKKFSFQFLNPFKNCRNVD